jgi:hypothetical protein
VSGGLGGDGGSAIGYHGGLGQGYQTGALTDTTASINGRAYGGGQGGLSSASGGCPSLAAGSGAVRIIWPGDERSFPNNASDV